MLKTRLMKVQIFLALTTLLLASCGGGNVPEATPTLGVDQIQTYAVSTFAAALTGTALAAPSSTPAATQTQVPTIQLPATATGGAPPVGGALGTPGIPVSGATASCYGLTFVSDVSIPDNTQMNPGKPFTKTWKVQNSGSCAWEAGFKFQNTGGDAMSGATFTLPATVASGATYDISVPMTAPNTPGTARGNWRMATANGQLFGDEVFVVVSVAGAAGDNTAEPAASATPTQ